MKQAEIVAAVANGEAEFSWVAIAPDVEVMAWPVRIKGSFVAASARTAMACAAALSDDEWAVSLTTPKLEDMIYEAAALRPEPVLLNPSKINIASQPAIAEHSRRLLELLEGTSASFLVACGKSWVQSAALLQHPGRAANYGLYSTSAPYRSVNKAHKLWQPLSFAHNLDHYDYSQLLRLARVRRGAALPSYDAAALPSSTLVTESPPSVASVQASESVAQGTLGERCLAWCLEETRAHEHPNVERITWYHAVAVRNGKPLTGLTTQNHCASAQSRALLECLLPNDTRPHEPRAGALELQQDAMKRGNWHSAAEVRARKWFPRPGDLAIYDRSDPKKPETSWFRHVDRVIQISDDGSQYENIGANEIARAWRREWSRFANPKLLGFVAYPGIAPTDTELAAAQIELGPDQVG
jgi:hypothetical protein